MTTFEVNVLPDEMDGWIITIIGDMDLATAPDVLDAGNDVFAKAEPAALIVELSGVTFVDSTGLGVLVQLRNLAQARGTIFRLEAVSKAVLRAMSLAGLVDIFELTDGADAS